MYDCASRWPRTWLQPWGHASQHCIRSGAWRTRWHAMLFWHWYGHWWLASSIITALCWPVYQAHWWEDCSQYLIQLHDLCTQPGDQSTWRHCSVNSTGYGFRSEFSFVCASWLTAAFMAAHHHTSLRHCIWHQIWNHAVACGPGLHGSAITTSYIGWPGIPRGCGTSLELTTDICQVLSLIHIWRCRRRG